MDSESHHSSPRSIAAAALVAVALAGGGYLVGRGDRAAPPPVEAPAVPDGPAKPIATPAPIIPPPLGRADLIKIAAAAADAYAGGREVPVRERRIGRRFSVRIPFGCGGPSKESLDPLGWSYDAERKSLRLRGTPQEWAEKQGVEERIKDTGIESVEGFWIPRPWTSGETCPLGADATPAEPSQTLGIAQFFDPDSPRRGQRGGRAFETVEKIEPASLTAGAGFHLLLEGRLAALPDGGGVLCHGDSAHRRPTCLIAVQFDRVSIENPTDGGLLAEWQF